MPSGLKKWLIAVSTLLCAVFLVWLWNEEYGLGILFSFLHADWAIPYWLRIGVGVWPAIMIAAICGGIGLFHLDWIAGRSMDIVKFFARFWRELSATLKTLIWAISFLLAGVIFAKIGIRWSIIIVAICLSVAVFERIWPRKKKVVGEKKNYPAWLMRMRYLALVLFPIDPYFGASLGIAFYKALGLKKLPSLVMLNIGNTSKMVFIGFGWNLVNESTRSWSTNSYIAFVATIIVASIIIFRLIRR